MDASADSGPAGTGVRGALSRVREWGGRELYRLSMAFLLANLSGMLLAATTEEGYRIAEGALLGIRSIPYRDASATEAPPHEASKREETPRDEGEGGEAETPEEPSYFQMWRTLFKQNVRVALIAAAGGILVRLIPWGIALFNGVLLGMCMMAMQEVDNRTGLEVMAALAPHGIFEGPALVLACAIGLRLHRVARPPTLKGRAKAFLGSWRPLLIVIFLLTIAASIEAR